MLSDYVWVKLKEQNEFRKVLSSEEMLFDPFPPREFEKVPYDNDILLDDSQWFYLEIFNDRFHPKRPPLPSAFVEVNADNNVWEQIMGENTTGNYNTLTHNEWKQAECLFVTRDKITIYQRIGKSKRVRKRGIHYVADHYIFLEDTEVINIKEVPDAVYDRDTHELYFKQYESIAGIFPGIDQIRIEATPQEVDDFLSKGDIPIKCSLTANDVKTANRKRILKAVAILEQVKALNKLADMQRYLKDYWPNNIDNGKFVVSSEKELKELLYGIEERYYKTEVLGERRLANSVIPL